MDRDELAALDKDALIELIVRLYERVTELEAGARRPPKTPGNSSIPPSAGHKPNRAERRRKKRGPKKGHQGLSRRRAVPDAVLRCWPTACQGCGAALVEAGQRRVRRSQVVELPELRPVVIEAWVYADRCAACGERTVGVTPAGLEAARTFGPRVEALLGYFHERHHVSYERLVEICRDVLGLAISQGGVENALARLAERMRTTNTRYLEAQADLLASRVDGGALASLARPVMVGTRRVPGLKLEDDRVIRLLEALLHPGTFVADWTTREVHARVLARHRLTEADYRLTQLRYDLGKLRAHQLVERLGTSRRYRLTARGLKLGVLLVKLRTRRLGPLASLASDERPRHPTRTTSEVEAAFHQVDTALHHLCDTLGLKPAA